MNLYRSGSGSGSGDILESLKLAIGQGIKNKIGEIAKGSAAATARLSSSSSSHGYSYHHSPHPPEVVYKYQKSITCEIGHFIE